MLLDKFEVGKRYRFNKELLSKHMKLNGWEDGTDWADDVHLHEVVILSGRDAHIGMYAISPEWCEEVIVIEPLKTRDDIKDMYKQVLYLEELEETLDDMDEYASSQMKSNFVKYINSEIERVIDELGLEE